MAFTSTGETGPGGPPANAPRDLLLGNFLLNTISICRRGKSIRGSKSSNFPLLSFHVILKMI